MASRAVSINTGVRKLRSRNSRMTVKPSLPGSITSRNDGVIFVDNRLHDGFPSVAAHVHCVRLLPQAARDQICEAGVVFHDENAHVCGRDAVYVLLNSGLNAAPP